MTQLVLTTIRINDQLHTRIRKLGTIGETYEEIVVSDQSFREGMEGEK
jgi:hypothetical protein